ncbi:MAG: hypothetical protein QUV04_08675 [Synechococcus sp. WH 8007]|nr:hypothetical protein [Synechococcus sp. WH 8007]
MRGRPLWLSLAVLLLAGAGLSWLQRITYRRMVGEKPLSSAQLCQLIANPTSYRSERDAIGLLLQQLERVLIVVRQSNQEGATGQ